MKYIYTFILIFLSGCSTRQIIRDSEYKYSEASFKSGDISQALSRFPNKEKGGFVTSIEKSWLSFWNGEREFADLATQSTTLDERQFTSVLRETKYFFYSESEDGYIPAEHEIIIMHLLNSMFFIRNEEWDKARVEARKAAFFLQSYEKEDQPHFDDPALRIWLAGIWATLGEWPEAQVDLRKAYELSKNKELIRLFEMPKPPADLSVVFDGNGPQVIWKEDSPAPEFRDESMPPTALVKFSTLPWFLRHEERNSQIRNVVMKSNYMAQYYGLNTAVGAEKSVGFIASNGVRLTGVILGSAIIAGGFYLLAQSGGGASGDAPIGILGAGVLVLTEFWKYGDKIAKEFEASSSESKQAGLERLRTYRFVRFMPSWISFVDSRQVFGFVAKSFTVRAPKSQTQVLFLQRF